MKLTVVVPAELSVLWLREGTMNAALCMEKVFEEMAAAETVKGDGVETAMEKGKNVVVPKMLVPCAESAVRVDRLLEEEDVERVIVFGADEEEEEESKRITPVNIRFPALSKSRLALTGLTGCGWIISESFTFDGTTSIILWRS